MWRRVRVRVPATSANIGPGFDAFGLALELFDEIEVRRRDDREVRVTVEGEGADRVARDESHLVVRAMRTAFEAAGQSLPGVEVHCVNGVPHGRGLGSSAAAIVGGVAAAFALLGYADPATGEVDRDQLFQLAANIEGHPDNVAPCVYGGFTIAWCEGATWRALGQWPSPEVWPIVCVPQERLATEQARGLLPETVPHADAAFTAGRAALLSAALVHHPELLLEATEDRLHESYRKRAMPASAALIRTLRENDRLAAVISGAGPSVLVLVHESTDRSSEREEIRSDLVDSIRERVGRTWLTRPLRIDPAGVCISSPRS